MNELSANEQLLSEVKDRLAKYVGPEQVLLSRRSLRNALNSYLAGRVNETELIEWAGLIEFSDEVVYEPGFVKLIANVVFQLATSEISGPITPDQCREMIAKLDT
jgi:hypothetical protein